MSDYTPTTQQVEDGYAHEPEYEYHNPVDYGAHVHGNRRAFRRWLKEHDAEVERAAAARALEEFADQMTTGFNAGTLNAERRAIKREARARAEASRQEREEQ